MPQQHSKGALFIVSMDYNPHICHTAVVHHERGSLRAFCDAIPRGRESVRVEEAACHLKVAVENEQQYMIDSMGRKRWAW